MVAEISESSVTIAAADQCVDMKEELPAGNYILVGVDIDTTGRRLIDEIVQLAAYTPKDNFQQYIMPYMNLNPAARQRHQIRVISIGFYRMLKSMQTYKIIKSKSEVAALMDFLNWLEMLVSKQANTDGIVMLYHEERKFIPYMILEAVKKYGLIDRFNRTVKSFANTFNMAKASLGDTNIKNCGLRKLSMLLAKPKDDISNKENEPENVKRNGSSNDKGPKNGLNHEQDCFEGSANVRAKMVYNVALQLSNSESKSEPETSDEVANLFNAVKPFAQLVSSDVMELQTQNENLGRQNSFRPVFLNYFRTTLYHRVRAVKFRIVLAENGFTLDSLKAIWTEKRKEGLELVLTAISTLKPEEKTELLDLLDSFYDPSKATIKPSFKPNGTRRRTRANGAASSKNGAMSSRSTSAEFGAGGDKSQSQSSVPDSTTKSPSPSKTVGRSHRKRNNTRNSFANAKGPKKADQLASNTELNTSAPESVPVDNAMPTQLPPMALPTQVAIAATN
ncbi:maternal protein exuperantia-1 [Drosophila obscura]|uniref:maternal protein exuperantia-1 n=1 Tax=Drosophila obscura TaxID=7282 RepID=UPI000BA1808F|nr:maternal protein exuperantia-1 [Drosophila obscura]XP_022228166.1 maternal protein exuperantia-1 [Drosophila obscura]XP_041449239.1 maternal protein exuperantia-1 [Drosophila obscura]